MPLQAQLFRSDPKLEAAAVSDPAHVVPGAKGPHVVKIQRALIQLDGADIAPDGQYGAATANAVLAYKRKRNVVNRSYQTQADNVVGKMTMAALDREMYAYELNHPSDGPFVLRSHLFRCDQRWQRCLASDADQVMRGEKGPHVAKLQYALMVLQGGEICGREARLEEYGPETAKVVLAYKTRRRIVNLGYQTKPDDVVGKMTILALDTEMVGFEARERLLARRTS